MLSRQKNEQLKKLYMNKAILQNFTPQKSGSSKILPLEKHYNYMVGIYETSFNAVALSKRQFKCHSKREYAGS